MMKIAHLFEILKEKQNISLSTKNDEVQVIEPSSNFYVQGMHELDDSIFVDNNNWCWLKISHKKINV